MTRIHFNIFRVVGSVCVVGVFISLMAGHMLILPDNELVFEAYLEPRFNVLYRMDIAHRLTRQVTNEALYDVDPNWSPDGQQIAFVGLLDQTLPTIYIIDAVGKDLRPLLDSPQSDSSPAWSPDGQQIAYLTMRYMRTPELMLTNVQSGQTRRLTNNRITESNPTWSPDGQHLTYASNETKTKTIYNLDLQTGDSQALITSSDNVDYPAWSPDGRYLLYIANGQTTVLNLWDVIQKQSILLHSGTFIPTYTPDWSPDGRFIAYTAYINSGDISIFKLEVAACIKQPDQCQPELLTTTPGVYQNPRWRPHA